MARWKQGEELYNKLISNLTETVSNHSDIFTLSDSKAISFAKDCVPEFIDNLKTGELILIHEYFMFIRTRKDPRWSIYPYTGGDRVIAVTRYIINNVELELAKQYI